MGDVIQLDNVTRLDIPPDRVLQSALHELKSVVVIGYDNEDREYFASSIADGGEVLWLLERTKHRLITVGENEDFEE